jgi:hypothetical protein
MFVVSSDLNQTMVASMRAAAQDIRDEHRENVIIGQEALGCTLLRPVQFFRVRPLSVDGRMRITPHMTARVGKTGAAIIPHFPSKNIALRFADGFIQEFIPEWLERVDGTELDTTERRSLVVTGVCQLPSALGNGSICAHSTWTRPNVGIILSGHRFQKKSHVLRPSGEVVLCHDAGLEVVNVSGIRPEVAATLYCVRDMLYGEEK